MAPLRPFYMIIFYNRKPNLGNYISKTELDHIQIRLARFTKKKEPYHHSIHSLKNKSTHHKNFYLSR
jgi:hypothetical protein